LAYNRFSVEIPGLDYWKKQIKCQNACPVHTDARGYVRAIADGDFEKAYLIARGPNPLASICGRICGAPCELSCRRSDVDGAISIRALKRFVTQKFGSESQNYDDNPTRIINDALNHNTNCQEIDELKSFLKSFRKDTFSDSSPSVGIIGSGPAGLAAAHDLCLMGVKPVIYEMEPVPAGMLYLGVPEYRLPKKLITAEIEVIKSLGTQIHCNVHVGEDITLTDLRKKHSAVLIAVGAKKSRSIPMPNIEAPGVIGGIDFLRDVALGNTVNLGEKIVVIGGGNVAYDVARSLIRHTEYDVSRTAIRQENVKGVSLVCLESSEEMPADDLEIHEGEEEGIIRYNSWGPKEILVDNKGKACGIKFVKCITVFDEKGRFSPKYDEADTLELEADNIVLSVGQGTDLSFIDSDDIALNDRGQLKLDTLQINTDAEGVFAAGDVAYGPKLMIDAIASGKLAARTIHSYVTKKRIKFKSSHSHSVCQSYEREIGYENIRMEAVPTASAEERKNTMDVVVEKGFGLDQAQTQASRCYNCAINTIFDSEKCVLCGGCADVCPEKCLKLVPLTKLEGNEDFENLIDHYIGEVPKEDSSAIIKDETRCIRCGLCSERCPVDAITMEAFNFKEVLADEG
jgi:formate dehydrogenase beta subunit